MSIKFIDCPSFLADLVTPELAAIVPNLEWHQGSPSRDRVQELLSDCQFLMNDHTEFDAKLLQFGKKLKAIVFMGTGASSYIDLGAAERYGIRVRTISGYGDRSVAEHAIGLMFCAGRKIATMDRALRVGKWETLDSVEFHTKTLGVVGVGGIGSEMVRLGAALGMKVVAWNRSGVSNGLPATEVELEDLLAMSDVVSLHLSLTNETAGLIDAHKLSLLSADSILINTARGGLIDEEALIDLLRGRKISHAALDVFGAEPVGPDHPILQLENVTLTAHAGFMTREASARLLRMGLDILSQEIAVVPKE